MAEATDLSQALPPTGSFKRGAQKTSCHGAIGAMQIRKLCSRFWRAANLSFLLAVFKVFSELAAERPVVDVIGTCLAQGFGAAFPSFSRLSVAPFCAVFRLG